MRTPPLNILDREFLIWLRENAQNIAESDINPSWRRAYLALADAADRLDAMQSRCIVPVNWSDGSPVPLEIGKETGWASDCNAPECDCDKTTGCKGSNYPVTATTNNL